MDYVVLKHALSIFSSVLRARVVFSVDGDGANQLSYLVLGKTSPAADTTEYLVMIANPSWNVQPFKIAPGDALGCGDQRAPRRRL